MRISDNAFAVMAGTALMSMVMNCACHHAGDSTDVAADSRDAADSTARGIVMTGKGQVDDNEDGSVGVRFYEAPRHDVLVAVKGLKHLRSVSIWASKVDSQLMDDVASLPVEELRLSGCELSKGAFDALRGLKTVRRLDLSGSNVDDLSMKTIAGMEPLEVLDISHTRVRAAGLGALSATQLVELRLQWVTLEQPEVEAIASIKSLRRLVMPMLGARVDPAPIGQLVKLEQLNIGSKRERELLLSLCSLPKLTDLTVKWAAITQPNATLTAKIRSLESLEVYCGDSSGDRGAVAALAHLPKLKNLTLHGALWSKDELSCFASFSSLERLRLLSDPLPEGFAAAIQLPTSLRVLVTSPELTRRDVLLLHDRFPGLTVETGKHGP